MAGNAAGKRIVIHGNLREGFLDRCAQVSASRASFYRNYDSKEDVLLTLIEDVLEEFRRVFL